MSTLNAVIVTLTINQFGNTRQDPSITKEIKAVHALAGNAGRWVKNKLPDEALKPIQKIAAEARQTAAAITLPWEDGSRLLPLAARDTYESTMVKLTTRFLGAVDRLVSDWEFWVEQARIMHNGTFNADDYPSTDKIKDHFRMISIVRPVPSSSHFDSALRNLYGASLEQDVQERTQKAMQDLWDRLIAPVAHMASKLADPDAIFRDSLVVNVQEIINIAPALNLTNSSQVVEAINRIKSELAGLDPEVLRQNKVARRVASTAAKDIVNSFGRLGSRKFN